MTAKMILIKKNERCVPSDFLVAVYPVTLKMYEELVGGKAHSQEGATYVKKCTWKQEILFCNLLSKTQGYPVSYHEHSGVLVNEAGKPAKEIDEVKGFRLPTSSPPAKHIQVNIQ